MALTAAAALTFLLLEPLSEGRNAHATLWGMYFQDPFLAYVYASSALFFAALVRTYRLLGRLGKGLVPSEGVVLWARFVARCMAGLSFLVAVPVVCLLVARPGDDIAGGVAVGSFLAFLCAAASLAARTCGRWLRISR